MFGQLCVVDPLDGVGFGDGEAAKTGEARKRATRALIATINAKPSLRHGLDFAATGTLCGDCAGCSSSLTLRSPPCNGFAPSVGRQAQSKLGAPS